MKNNLRRQSTLPPVSGELRKDESTASAESDYYHTRAESIVSTLYYQPAIIAEIEKPSNRSLVP